MNTADITKHALMELDLRNVECWRQNNIRVPGRTFHGKKGLPDILGFNRSTGLFVMCEVKNRGDKLSQDQIDLLDIGFKAGVVTLIATVDKQDRFQLIPYKPD
jgi:Holliday junction resolvase